MTDIDQSQRGLYHKFSIQRTDGRDAPGEKHHGCDLFVLDLDHDPHAVKALTAYADSLEADIFAVDWDASQPTYPKLLAELRDKLFWL